MDDLSSTAGNSLRKIHTCILCWVQLYWWRLLPLAFHHGLLSTTLLKRFLGPVDAAMQRLMRGFPKLCQFSWQLVVRTGKACRFSLLAVTRNKAESHNGWSEEVVAKIRSGDRNLWHPPGLLELLAETIWWNGRIPEGRRLTCEIRSLRI